MATLQAARSKTMKHVTKFVVALLAIGAVVGSLGMVSAHESNYDTTYVGNATEMGVNATYTYDTIQNATNNVAENGSVVIQNGTYNLTEEINITENNLTYKAHSGNVTLDVNTTSGYAFNTSNVSDFTVGENITVSGNVYAGGGGGTSGAQSTLETQYYGFPLWAYLLAILATLAGLYEYGDRV